MLKDKPPFLWRYAVAIISLEERGNITMWDEAARRIFGWEANEVIGFPVPAIPTDRQADFDQKMGKGTGASVTLNIPLITSSTQINVKGIGG